MITERSVSPMSFNAWMNRSAFRAALLAASACALQACATASAPRMSVTADTPQAEDAYFTRAAAAVAERAAGRRPARAKNVILFIGDGMGVSTVTAARIRGGELKGMTGPEANVLTMESLPESALVRTYSHDHQVSDSASTATAMTTGAKTNSGTTGVSSSARPGVCAGAAEAEMRTLFEIAETAGLATGVVSTARITHATPSGVYAHTPARDWEGDSNLTEEAVGAGCRDIARQLVEWPYGDGLELAMGGGRPAFLPNTAADPEDAGEMGGRLDGRDLTAEWAAKGPEHAFIWSQAQFDATDFNSDTRVLALFERSHMEYEHDRPGDTGGEPSLEAMTRAAITRLSRDPDGYVLMVEGGRIDHAHHAGNAFRALDETLALDRAVAVALEMTSPEDTLIIVTADHSHTLTIAGYPMRGAPILGLAIDGVGVAMRAADGKPYTTLGYANGPGSICAAADCVRPNLTDVDTTDPDFLQPSTAPMYSETHGGEDVPAYASGPGSALVEGSIEQNELFHVMARSLGFAP